MQRIIRLLIAALVGVLIVLAGFLCLFVEQLTRTTAELPTMVDQAIAREANVTRSMLDKRVGNATESIDRQITGLRQDVFTRVDSLQSKTFTEIDQIRVDANRQLDETRTAAVAEISKVSTPAGATLDNIQALLPPAQHILANTSETSDLLLDCDHNPDCFANRIIPALKSTERMAKAGETTLNVIAQTAPETAAATKSTAKDIAAIVHEITKPTTWIKKAAGTAASIVGKFFGM